jgi:hypothetical protein
MVDVKGRDLKGPCGSNRKDHKHLLIEQNGLACDWRKKYDQK